MIVVNFNGNNVSIPNKITVEEFAKIYGYRLPIVIFINGNKLKIAQYKDSKINHGDKIIIKRVLGGG